VILEINSRDTLAPYTSSKWASISRVVMPREYSDSTTELTLLSRRVSLGTIAGSNNPLRSRGTCISTGPLTVVTVFGVEPLRELPDPRPAGSPTPYPRWWVNSEFNARSNTALVNSLSNPSAPSIGVPDFTASLISESNVSAVNVSANRRAAAFSSTGNCVVFVTKHPSRPPNNGPIMNHPGLTQTE
jgi:hypothetical protein